MGYLVGLDIGTTSCKAYALAPSGAVVAKTSKSYELSFGPEGRVEQNPEDWWLAVVSCLRELASKVSDVEALSVSSQANTLVLLGDDRRPLGAAISWLDQRSASEVNEIVREVGLSELRRRTGLMPGAGFTAPKLLWASRRGLLAKARAVLFSPQSYVLLKLTGELVVDRTLASFSMLYDLRRRGWLPEILALVGLDEEALPRLVESCDVVGSLRREVAAEVGLSPDTVVVAGAHDQCCAALGAGLTGPGTVVDSAGTASAVMSVLDSLPDEIPGGLMCYHYLAPGKWTALGTVSASGALLSWILKLAGMPGGHGTLEARAGELSAGSDGVVVIPYFSGSFRPGVPHDARGAILGLTLGHGPHHLYRAALEALAFEARFFVEAIKAAGGRVRLVVSVGGGARSRLWREIKAGVLRVPVAKPVETDTAPLGAAILAGVGSGAFRDLSEGASKVVRVEEVVEPDRELAEAYDGLYRRYLEVAAEASRLTAELAPR